MNDEQNNQSVKDILEDIKKAISGKNVNSPKIEKEDDDILHLKEEYLEEEENKEPPLDLQDESDDELSISEEYLEEDDDDETDQSDELDYNTDQNFEPEELKGDTISPESEESDSRNSNDHLILKENIEDIKALLLKVQSELQQKQQPNPSLTVEELVISLLKPELSEWLNKHLYKLVKEIVEKELRDILNNSK